MTCLIRERDEMVSDEYSAAFYNAQKGGSLSSSRTIVPWIVEMLKPASVIDVGCGIGTWTSEYIQAGVPRVLGLDGSYVDVSQLVIPAANFRAVDLSLPLKATDFGRFDLVNCLEVAEHLPTSASDSFVSFLTELSDIIVFGAAVPDQGGTHHVNEQWQSFWCRKFEQHNFTMIDALRPRFWGAPVEWWYIQNTFIFVSDDAKDRIFTENNVIVDAIHPRNYQRRMNEIWSLRKENAALKQRVKDLEL